MPRTTVEVDAAVLQELRVLQEREGRPLDSIISQLLAEALANRNASPERHPFEWRARPMNALVDLSDRDAVEAGLDQDHP